MKYSELAYRYASAVFELAKEAGKTDEILAELIELSRGLEKDTASLAFISSPLITATEKEALFVKVFAQQKISDTGKNFILLLAKKDRVQLLSQIANALEAKQDEMNKVTRGEVRSAAELTAGQKAELEKEISAVVGKRVILSYVIDRNVVGGLTAQVGSLTFDDTISAHLKKMQDDLNRRAH